MSLTLGLNTAISGMMTGQRQLDVIAQNVSNVNTPGYTRKVLVQESRVLAGRGAGVQTGDVTRTVDEGLLKHLRNENAKLSELKVVDEYQERLDQQFGTPADNTSISHVIADFQIALENLSNEANKQTSTLSAVRSAQDVTDLFNRMATEVQTLRSDADQRISDLVTKVNDKISEIHTLNGLIVKNNATGTGTADLTDKRDAALTELGKYIDITYYSQADGNVAVYTGGGNLLVDAQPNYLSHNAVSRIEAVNTKAGGALDGVWVNGIDISTDVRGGELKGLLTIRDDMLTNFQAGLDQLAGEVMDRMNQVHNRGTSFPDAVSTMTGTRTFATQSNVTQQIKLSGTGDTMINVFDSNGEQVASASLNTIMQTNYGAGNNAAQASHGWWTVNQVTAHMQSWLQASGYPSAASASVGLNSDGKLAIDLGNSSYTLAFRDQATSTAGDTATDATIQYDVDGNGVAEQSVDGFSNFFGLNDLLVTNKKNWLYDSKILPTSTTSGSVARTIRFYDQSGQLGTGMTIGANSSLDDIAATINKYSAVMDSTIQNTGYTIPASLNGDTLTLSGPYSNYGTYTASTGDSLSTIATAITAMGLNATVVSDGSGQRLRITDSSGKVVTASGNLASELGMNRRELVKASVVPEGAGVRLRIQHTEGGELFIGADQDVSGNSLLTDLEVGAATATKSQTIAVNQAIIDAPYSVSRGAVQFDATTGKYFIREGDNSTALAMAAAANDKVVIPQAGGLGSGSYGLAEYGAALLSNSAREHDVTKGRMDYQNQLTESIQFQHDSMSGVNVDEEVSNMITYQQAYVASAKIITTLQEMLDTLTGMIK